MRVCYREFQGFSTIQTQNRKGCGKHLLHNLFQKEELFTRAMLKPITQDPLQASLKVQCLLATTENLRQNLPCKIDFVTPASVSKATVNIIYIKIA